MRFDRYLLSKHETTSQSVRGVFVCCLAVAPRWELKKASSNRRSWAWSQRRKIMRRICGSEYHFCLALEDCSARVVWRFQSQRKVLRSRTTQQNKRVAAVTSCSRIPPPILKTTTHNTVQTVTTCLPRQMSSTPRHSSMTAKWVVVCSVNRGRRSVCLTRSVVGNAFKIRAGSSAASLSGAIRADQTVRSRGTDPL